MLYQRRSIRADSHPNILTLKDVSQISPLNAAEKNPLKQRCIKKYYWNISSAWNHFSTEKFQPFAHHSCTHPGTISKYQRPVCFSSYVTADCYVQFVSATKSPAVLYWKFSHAAARYNCGRSHSGIAGSNISRGTDVCLLWMLCVVRYRPLRRADPSSKGILPSVFVSMRVWSSATITLYTYNK